MAALADLLCRCRVLAVEDPALVQRGLVAIASLLRRGTTPDGEEGFSLFHHSLRQHMERSDEMNVPLAVRRADLRCLRARTPRSVSGMPLPTSPLPSGLPGKAPFSPWLLSIAASQVRQK